MFMTAIVGFRSIGDAISVDFKGIIILAVLMAIAFVGKLAFKKKLSPVLMILISAGLGMVMYSI